MEWLVIYASVIGYLLAGGICLYIIKRGQRLSWEPAWMIMLHDFLVTLMWPIFAGMTLVALAILGLLWIGVLIERSLKNER